MDLYGKYPQSAIVGPTAIKVGPTSLTNFGFKNCWTWQPCSCVRNVMKVTPVFGIEREPWGADCITRKVKDGV